MTSSIKSADSLIIQTENEKLGKQSPEPVKEDKASQKAAQPKAEAKPESSEAPESASDQKEEAPTEESSELKQEPQEESPQKEGEKSASDDSLSDEVDDYGNPISKGKLYTEEQVQKMIRDRLARGRVASQTPEQSQQVQEAVKDFKADPESSEGWEQQLESFIEKTITKVSQKSQQEDWKRKEQDLQDQFEDKFTRGMGRYGDFQDVVSGKPITNSMMMATRSMQDPAAFLYAACKQHPTEIQKIAEMPDAVSQIAAIGRLEEKMKKVKSITKAPTPAKKITGDMSDAMPVKSVDQLIQEHAKSKIMNRR